MGSETITVLQGLDLELAVGESVSVVGASGSGKTTMIHVLGLLDKPDSGELRLNGENLFASSGSRQAQIRNRSFGFVFQFYHLVHELTAVENVMLPAMIDTGWLRWSSQRLEVRERARSLLADVGLSGRERHRPQQLSGGERQRVAIARALMNDPEVLFCDEPTGNLDPRTSEGVQELVLSVAARGRAVLLVTHDARFAARCDRVLRLKEGRLVPGPPSGGSGGTS